MKKRISGFNINGRFVIFLGIISICLFSCTQTKDKDRNLDIAKGERKMICENLYTVKVKADIYFDLDLQGYEFQSRLADQVFEFCFNDKFPIFNNSEHEVYFSKSNENSNWKLKKTFVARRSRLCFFIIWNSNRLGFEYPGINIDDIALSDTVITSLTKSQLLSIFPQFKGVVAKKQVLFYTFDDGNFNFQNYGESPLHFIKDKKDSIRFDRKRDSLYTSN